MIKYENECCDCAVPSYPCIGELCPNRNVPHIYCDKCGQEIYEDYYDIDDEDVCEDCLNEHYLRRID